MALTRPHLFHASHFAIITADILRFDMRRAFRHISFTAAGAFFILCFTRVDFRSMTFHGVPRRRQPLLPLTPRLPGVRFSFQYFDDLPPPQMCRRRRRS